VAKTSPSFVGASAAGKRRLYTGLANRIFAIKRNEKRIA
jgi:hypothetical protein